LVNDKRGETEIIYDLLLYAKNDIKKTHLMYKTNMTHKQFNKYLDALLEKGLIEKKDSSQYGKIYFTTNKGIKVLESLDIVINYLRK
jgi:predicted transcriptional regulator